MQTKEPVWFTKQQVELLLKAFPASTINPESKIETIMFEAGQRHVVSYIARLVAKEGGTR